MVFGLQKKAMRVISCNDYKAYIDPIQLPEIKDLYKLKILKLYYNTVANNVHESIRILLPRRSYSHVTYIITKIIIQKYAMVARNSLAYNFPKLINTTSNLNIEKRDTHSYFGFALYINNGFNINYNIECNIMCTRSNK